MNRIMVGVRGSARTAHVLANVRTALPELRVEAQEDGTLHQTKRLGPLALRAGKRARGW